MGAKEARVKDVEEEEDDDEQDDEDDEEEDGSFVETVDGTRCTCARVLWCSRRSVRVGNTRPHCRHTLCAASPLLLLLPPLSLGSVCTCNIDGDA
jgi:hypothetical protein